MRAFISTRIRSHLLLLQQQMETLLITTLERYVRALGGELEVRAKFSDREVTLTQFVQRKVLDDGD